jgi:hypothetical protein
MGATYTKPELRRFGSVADLTAQHYNKVGPSMDIYTALTQGDVVGSLVPVP